MKYKKGDLYVFDRKQPDLHDAPTNVFSLVTHFVDEEDGQDKLVLREPGTNEPLVADADDMICIKADFEEKLLFTLTDIAESLRSMSGTDSEKPKKKKDTPKDDMH